MSETVKGLDNPIVTATPAGTTATLELTGVQAYGEDGTCFWNFKVINHPDATQNGLYPRGLAIKDPAKLKDGMERNITIRNIQNLMNTLTTAQQRANVKDMLTYLNEKCVGMTVQAKIEIKPAKDTGTLFNNIYPQAPTSAK